MQAQINDTNADLANEINRATTAETDLQAQINEKASIVDLEQETLDRINADADLQAQIDQEKIDREVGDSDLQSTIDVEMSRIEVEQADQNRKIENIENILLANINALYKPTNDVAITTSTKVPLTLLDGTSDVIVNSNIRIPNVATGTVLKYNFNFDLSGDGTGYGRAINVTKGGITLGGDTPIQGETKFQVTRVVKVVDGTPSVGEANVGDEIEIQLTKTTGTTFSVLSANSTITAQGTSSSAPSLTNVTTNDVATANVSFVADGSSSTLAFNELDLRMVALEETTSGDVRTLINDKDINYDDTIHATTPLQDILNDLFNKAEIMIGNDKPFELNFRIATGVNDNLKEACLDLIEQKYGYRMTNDFFNFSMKVATSHGISNENGTNLNLVSIFSDSDGIFSWVFDYDNWSNVIVRDASGNTSHVENVTATTENISYYVSPTGSDSNDGLTESSPFLTIQKAIDMLPQVINHQVHIILAEAFYLEDVIINSHSGGGVFRFNAMGENVYVRSLTLQSIVARFEAYACAMDYVAVERCSDFYLNSIGLNRVNSAIGFDVSNSSGSVTNCTINDFNVAISSNKSLVFSQNNAGSVNDVVLQAIEGGVIAIDGTQPNGTTAEAIASGGEIRG